GTALTSAALCEARAVTLGPLQIDRMVMVQRDLSDLGRALGVEVAGAVGIDVLARAIARVRLAAGTVELFDPERFTLSDDEKEPRLAPASCKTDSGAAWTRLTIHGRHPHAVARYPTGAGSAREGLFRLDTGGGKASVVFHAPTVEGLGLLAGRAT